MHFPFKAPIEHIVKFGGKGGPLKYISEHLPDLPIPHMQFFHAGGNQVEFYSKLSRNHSLKSPLIMRSNDPCEYYGFEGEFHTRGIYDWRDNFREFEECLIAVTTSRRGMNVHRPIDGDIDVLVMPQTSSKLFGSMFGHPNKADTVVVTVYEPYSGSANMSWSRMGFFIDDNGKITQPDKLQTELYHDKKHLSFERVRPALDELTDAYRRISKLNSFDSAWTYVMEFGMHPNAVFQWRALRPKESATFSIESDRSTKDAFCLGVSPKDGVVLNGLAYGRGLSADVTYSRPLLDGGDNSIFLTARRDEIARNGLRHKPSVYGAVICDPVGIGIHDEQQFLRCSPFFALNPLDLSVPHNHLVKLISDGYRYRLEKI